MDETRLASGFHHLPAVARRVSEAGIHAAEAFHWLLREFHAAGAHSVVGGAAVVDRQHERRHCALRHDLAQRLRRSGVERRRSRYEEAELEGRLVRVLHREPAVVAVSHVGVDAKPKLFDVEIEGFALITNVQTDHFDTLAHGTSVSSDPFLSLAPCRRFSETAIVRSGRCAALRKQAGTRSGSRGRACSRARSSLGLSPVMSRNVRPNVPRLLQPVWKAISVMARSVSRSKAVALSIRR